MVATMDELKGFHEVFSERERINAGSDRAFGIVFALLFLIIGGFPILYGSDLRFWALGIGSVFFGVAIIAPQILRPLNIIWFKFGMLLHKIVNPIVMGLLFFFTVTPIAFIMRLINKDPLNCKFDPEASTYWIKREAGEPEPENMRRQF